MTKSGKRANAVGINHVALEVGDIQQAIDFYGSFIAFEIESQNESAAFIYFGDQFINFMTGRIQSPDQGRHFGIVVDDKELVRERLIDAGIELLPGRFLDFLDPWGNRVEITTYRNIRFTKSDSVLKGMGLYPLEKSPAALEELADNGMVAEQDE